MQYIHLMIQDGYIGKIELLIALTYVSSYRLQLLWFNFKFYVTLIKIEVQKRD